MKMKSIKSVIILATVFCMISSSFVVDAANELNSYSLNLDQNFMNISDDAEEFKGHFYKVYTERLSWTEAEETCESLGGHLVTITSEEEQEFIESITSGRYWIGGFRDDNFIWYWVTGETWNYTNWDDGEPNNSSNVRSNENCAAIWPLKWNDLAETSTEQDGFICEWDADGILDIIDDEEVLIPDDVKEFNGHYYKVYFEKLSWTDAEQRCENLGGHLVTITSEEEQEFIESITSGRYWIGGFRDDNFIWYWITGETWNYTNWDDGEPNNSSNVKSNERYASIWPTKWNDLAETSTEQSGFICEWDADGILDIIDNDEEAIPEGVEEFNGHFYKVYFEKLSWTDAERRCESLGGHLVTITSEEEQKFIESITSGRYWIGGFRDDNFVWYWITGETWNYTNWDDGEPNNSSNVKPNERYASIWPSKWNDLAETSTEQSGFICEWDADGILDIIDNDEADNDEAAIPDDVEEFNGHFYKVYFEQLSWTDAERRCESLGGHLVTITSEEEQEFIESIASDRYWIGGFRDDNFVWYWITGETWYYTNWDDGEPNNSKNERYASIWPSKWNDLAETSTQQSGFICEWDADGILDIIDDEDIIIPYDAKEFNGHFYKVYFEQLSWTDAEQKCENLGGHLVTITSEEEQEFIESIASGKYWIGGFRDDNFVWYWVTGETWNYTNWDDGEPNNCSNVKSNERCAAIWPIKWNDLAETSTQQNGFICEWDDEIVTKNAEKIYA